MANLKYDKEITAVLVSDPYNDFISEGDKTWDRLKAVAEANRCVPGKNVLVNSNQLTNESAELRFARRPRLDQS